VIAKTGMASTYVAILGLLVFGAVFASLGAWQVRRADESRATLAQFAGGAAETALAELPASLDGAARFRRVELEGEYIAEQQFLLDNMLHEGAAGYHVLTPLRMRGSERRVLVNRGWVPVGDRRALPDVGVDARPRTISGRLERLPRPGLRLGADGEGGPERSVVVLQYPTAEALARRLGEPVYDYQVLLDADAPDGYVRDWQAPTLGPERHVAYAGQWFALAVGAAAAAVVIAVRTARRKA
jgi:surfeit locus 1 family protein